MAITESFARLYAVDWRLLMTAATQWYQGGNPYGVLTPEFGRAGAFAYPPTALSWLWIFTHFGSFSFIFWTLSQLACWWLIIRRHLRSQLVLLCWSPLVFNLLLGQTTLAVILVLWAATTAQRRGFWWGLAMAWAMTKPQAALLPTMWILWNDRSLPHRHFLWLGILAGSAALALPPTLMDQGIWIDWLHSLGDYRTRTMQVAPWQSFGIVILLAAFLLWAYRNRGSQLDAGWQWWLTAALFPQTHLYSSAALLPLLRPERSYWTIAGLALASILVGPATNFTLPIILSGHLLAAWFISGGPRTDKSYGKSQT